MEEGRPYEDGSQYVLPVDSPEHERLNAQHESLVALMDGRPLRAPVIKPTKILDMYVEPYTRPFLSEISKDLLEPLDKVPKHTLAAADSASSAVAAQAP